MTLHRIPPAGLTTLALGAVLAVAALPGLPGSGEAAPADVGEAAAAAQVYRAACANCHGAGGTGAPATVVAFDLPLPDFTDCGFATREPRADWYAVTHDGGPGRAFDRMMPAFGGLLSHHEIELALRHVRTFCPGDAWPRGELNLPRPLVTEKAFPEDELVFTIVIDTEGDGEVENELVYEKRFGARNQVELVVPFGWQEQELASPRPGGDDSDWEGGLGNLAVAVKRALYHHLDRGSIVSLTGEVILPTGDEQEGFGNGITIFEPFLTYGQILPADSFVQLQGGFEIPLESGADDEAFLRMALGKSFTAGRFGRVWTPMLEVLAARELVSGADTHWDLLPEVQVTLSTRQHVMANAGVRIPMDDTSTRDTQVLVYLLWDWFDGGLFEGW